MNAPSKTSVEWSDTENAVIDAFKATVQKKFTGRLSEIILYGSRARGDADEESDYDFLVLLSDLNEYDNRHLDEISFSIALEFSTVIVALAIQASKFTEERYFYFYENVCREGIAL